MVVHLVGLPMRALQTFSLFFLFFIGWSTLLMAFEQDCICPRWAVVRGFTDLEIQTGRKALLMETTPVLAAARK